MNSIALPQKIEFASGRSEFQATVSIEPCYPGFGVTLGNALRRVLLSSLPGAAVVGVKIAGADHEFMALPHVKEDVLEIILNLKKIRMRIHGEEPQVLNLDVHGERAVKAGDIAKNSQVEIANPELELAHITDMAGNLKIEIHAAPGRGYETIDSREKKNKEIGYIELDSAYSPVHNVGIDIENVRVGKMTNWDKLILQIDTDGTILPEEAFRQAVAILIDQFTALTYKDEEAEPEPAEEAEEAEAGVASAEEESVKVEEAEEEKPKRKRSVKKK